MADSKHRELHLLALKKAAVVLHALAFQMKEPATRAETLVLVESVIWAANEIEKGE